MLPEHIEALAFLHLVFHACTYPRTKAVQRRGRSQEPELMAGGAGRGQSPAAAHASGAGPASGAA